MNRFAKIFQVGVCAGFLAGCVDIAPGGYPGDTPVGTRPALEQRLDPGAKNLTSLHFEVHAYSYDKTREISDEAERLYSRIMTDTGLNSFRPRELYRIYIYGTREEFIRKTGLPEWSAGAARGTTLYSYEGPHLRWVLPHEMTHLIFSEYMGMYSFTHKWVNEGLAVYEEQQAAPFGAPSRYGDAPIPFAAMITMVPMTEKDRKVSAWYHQVGSVVRFMIERSRGPGFHIFLRALRDGKNLNEAVNTAYPAQWKTFEAVEQAWGSVR